MELLKTISRMLQDVRPGTDFGASADYVGEGLLDSFDLINLVSEIEREFRICIQGREIVPENFTSGAAIEALIRKHLA